MNWEERCTKIMFVRKRFFSPHCDILHQFHTELHTYLHGLHKYPVLVKVAFKIATIKPPKCACSIMML